MDLLLVIFLVLVALLFWRRGVVFLFLANRAFLRKDETATLKWFAEAWKLRQLNANMVASYAYQLLKAGKTDEADQILSEFAAGRRGKKPKPADLNLTQSYQSLVLYKRGRLEEAIELLLALRAEGYKTTTLYGNLGCFLLEKGDFHLAEEVCLEAREWAPSGKVILDNYASLQFKRGNLENAQEAYEALLELEPKFPEAWYGAALVALKLENPETAVELLEQALTLPFNALTTLSRQTVEAQLAEARLAEAQLAASSTPSN